MKDRVDLSDHLSHKISCFPLDPYFCIIYYEFRDLDDLGGLNDLEDLSDRNDFKVMKVSCFPLGLSSPLPRSS